MPILKVLADFLQMLLYGVVEGVTEWLPVSSTGHLILLETLFPLPMSSEMKSAFLVVIQLGAILAVLLLYWNDLWPLRRIQGRVRLDSEKIRLWLLIIIATLPAALVGLLADDWIEAHFYHPVPVAIALILVGAVFLLVEKGKAGKKGGIKDLDSLTPVLALAIGCFQLAAAVFPGVSRSGACILGALVLGMARPAAAKFSFMLAIPVMFGASFLKLLRMSALPNFYEVLLILIGSLAAFIVSLIAIRFLLNYVRRHPFTVFAFYRIVLGILVLLLALLKIIPSTL